MDWMPSSHQDLLRDDLPALAYLATVMPDGSPQVTPVWFDVEGDYLRINTARGRTKERNMAARPKVALAIADPSNPYRYAQVRGTVAAMKQEGAVEHIRRLSKKYTGDPDFPLSVGEARVMVLIRPDHVSAKR